MRKRFKKIHLFTFATILILTFFIFMTVYKNNTTDTLKYLATFEPSSADPLDYDLMAHHQVFRSTFSSLVSQYKRGEYVGILAETWSTTANFKIWKFKVRKGIQFENGDVITPSIITKSLMRMAFLLKKRRSKEGFLSKLKEFDKINSPQARIAGLRVSDNEIIFEFQNSMPNALELVSFGLYSIAHPDDYDNESGAWKNKKSLISSGPYKLSKWTEDNILLTLRESYIPGLGHSSKFKKISISWKRTLPLKNYDVIGGDDFDELGEQGFSFSGGAKSGILYLHCSSWKDQRSPLASHEVRNLIRDYFYYYLKQTNIDTVTSFFPLAIPGIKQIRDHFSPPTKKVDTQSILKFNYARRGSEYFKKAYEKAWESMKEILNDKLLQVTVTPPQVFDLNDPDLKEFSADFTLYGTHILIESPDDDIRFMFLSKEGIRLPDLTGRIHKLLETKTLDYQKINEELWNQAVIWPMAHFSSGIWIKPSIDVSQLNIMKPPIDFFWVGAK